MSRFAQAGSPGIGDSPSTSGGSMTASRPSVTIESGRTLCPSKSPTNVTGLPPEIAAKFGANENDTGSTQVQVALLTERINHLTEHLRTHSHDHHSRRGLLMLVGQRRRFLNYLQRSDLEGYRSLIKALGLRK